MSTSEILQNQLMKSKNRPKGLELDLEKLTNKSDSEKTILDLFRHAFITNCHLDEASVTSDELLTLDELSIEEVLENFTDLVNDLLAFKKEYRSTDKAELVQRSEQFENMLQKLEAEVRSHIRIEHQLQLHIESNQNKIDELEKYKLEAEARMLEVEDKGKNENFKGRNENGKDKALQKLEIECSKLKGLLEDKVKECERLKKVLDKYKIAKASEKKPENIDILRKKVEEKASGLNKIQQLTKDKSERNTAKPLERKNKKSMDEGNRSTPSPFLTKKEKENTLADPRPSTAKKSITRSHIRSNSDQTRPLTGKKYIL